MKIILQPDNPNDSSLSADQVRIAWDLTGGTVVNILSDLLAKNPAGVPVKILLRSTEIALETSLQAKRVQTASGTEYEVTVEDAIVDGGIEVFTSAAIGTAVGSALEYYLVTALGVATSPITTVAVAAGTALFVVINSGLVDSLEEELKEMWNAADRAADSMIAFMEQATQTIEFAWYVVNMDTDHVLEVTREYIRVGLENGIVELSTRYPIADIAGHYGIGVDELLQLPGNEGLVMQTGTDGVEYLVYQPGSIITLPNGTQKHVGHLFIELQFELLQSSTLDIEAECAALSLPDRCVFVSAEDGGAGGGDHFEIYVMPPLGEATPFGLMISDSNGVGRIFREGHYIEGIATATNLTSTLNSPTGGSSQTSPVFQLQSGQSTYYLIPFAIPGPAESSLIVVTEAAMDAYIPEVRFDTVRTSDIFSLIGFQDGDFGIFLRQESSKVPILQASTSLVNLSVFGGASDQNHMVQFAGFDPLSSLLLMMFLIRVVVWMQANRWVYLKEVKV